MKIKENLNVSISYSYVNYLQTVKTYDNFFWGICVVIWMAGSLQV